ncbi:hypothetical protein O7609_22920 [Streptomyces sp. WMMC1477]|nr:hypothetical protein [Streptomyces sp. WMMC1477]MCZ7434466.1 hypothetical protein [Streptomyces sp. WMMC1477]
MAAGALGARMTGGGFGGCVIALAPEEAVPSVSGAVSAVFGAHGLPEPRVFAAEPSAGARRLTGAGRGRRRTRRLRGQTGAPEAVRGQGARTGAANLRTPPGGPCRTGRSGRHRRPTASWP